MRFVFYPAQSGKPWNGETLTTEALGGSESAVAYMARELARLGHEVIVFTTAKPGLYDDVLYIDVDKARTLLLTLPCDVLVCSRDPQPIIWATRASAKVYWAHDVPQGPLPDAFDLYFMVSQWQAELFARSGFAPTQKIRVSPNGVDLKLFPEPGPLRSRLGVENGNIPPSDIPKLAWTSNPERGVWHAARILQEVRKTYPNAELHVYGRNSVYGWGMEYEHVFHPEPEHMAGVTFHSAMSKGELARELAEMDLLLYPTWWPETFCIAGLEAQAAGVPIVSTNVGALSETVRGGILIPGIPGEGTHDEEMAEAVVDLLRDGESRSRLAKAGRAYAETLGWDRLARNWHDVFSQALGLQ